VLHLCQTAQKGGFCMKVVPVSKAILRRRPRKIRYAYVASSPENVHTGCSHWGLESTDKKYGVNSLYLVDLFKRKVIPVSEPVPHFLKRWRYEYTNPKWDYEEDILKGIPVPGKEK